MSAAICQQPAKIHLSPIPPPPLALGNEMLCIVKRFEYEIMLDKGTVSQDCTGLTDDLDS
jgi:hypothetical protein